MKELLGQAWFGSVIGIVGIFVGVVVGIIIAYYFRARPRVACQVNSLELFGSQRILPDEIEFLFKGQKVPKVTLSRVAIWNKGNVTLRRDQIVAADPLRIITSNGSVVLVARIIGRTREVNDFAVRESGNVVECTFDYLDSQDGALVEVIHTGDDKLQVVGTLRGVPKRVLVIPLAKPQERQQNVPPSRSGAGRFGTAMTLIGILLLAASALLPYGEGTPLAFIVGGVFTVLGGALLGFLGRIPPQPLGTQITSGEPRKKRSGIFFRR